jgi:tRNA U55 pseudouridine synthase TruB
VARYSKVASERAEILIPYLKESLKEYQWIVKFAASHQLSSLTGEIEVCKQMVELLPLKIRKIALLQAEKQKLNRP